MLSCSTSPSRHESGVIVELDAPLQAASGLEQLVEEVVLRIFASDLDTMMFRLPVIEGRVSRTVDVSPGRDRIFEMSAYDADGRLLYLGADTVSIDNGLDQAIEIVLRPVILLMRMSPRYQEVEVGTSCEIGIYIFNVDSLFGAAFRLLYDETRIQVDGWTVGGFLGTGDDIIFKGFLESGFLGISYTRARGDIYSSGVSGSGLLATVYLTPLVSGESEIELGVYSEDALIKAEDGTPVDRIEELHVDGAVIAGKGVER